MLKEILGTAFPIIEKFAPTVASAIGTPISGIAASWALSLLAKAFGLDASNVANLPQVITDEDTTHNTLQGLENEFVAWFKNNSTGMKPPSNLEINIKMGWDQAN